jgi:anionic cell wall polymer biosynthesis LytR-Cps2A-Psr (LCP) family protein
MVSKKKFVLIILISTVVITVGSLLWFYLDLKSKFSDIKNVKSDALNIPENDTLPDGTIVSNDSLIAGTLDSLSKETDKIRAGLSGDRVSILITGVDSRLGVKSKRADANHLINIWLDSAFIEIISIPRGSDAPDESHYIANLRSIKGPEAYRRAVCKIASIDSIDYHIEFGLSQAIGLIELLGFKDNAVQVLRTLRSRKVFGPGDYQRSYNQGQFIRQMLLKIAPYAEDLSTEVMIRAGLLLVDTDLEYSTVKEIIKRLRQKGFPRSQKDVIVRILPKVNFKLLQFNWAERKAFDSLYKMVAKRSNSLSGTEDSVRDRKLYNSGRVSGIMKGRLNSRIKDAKSMDAKNPKGVINELEMPFKQRAWYQVYDMDTRLKIEKEICDLLSNAYEKEGRKADAAKVRKLYESDLKTVELLKLKERKTTTK